MTTPGLMSEVVMLHRKSHKNCQPGAPMGVLPHPLYSPDIAPSDFHLFRSLSIALRGVNFEINEDLHNWLEKWFGSNNAAFYRRGIEKLPKRSEEKKVMKGNI